MRKDGSRYFHQRGIEPFRVIYEDFVTDQRNTLEAPTWIFGDRYSGRFPDPGDPSEKASRFVIRYVGGEIQSRRPRIVRRLPQGE